MTKEKAAAEVLDRPPEERTTTLCPPQEPMEQQPGCARLQNQDNQVTAKRVATLIAEAALRGFVVHRLADGGFLACRWNLSRDLPDADALETFLRQVGGGHGR